MTATTPRYQLEYPTADDLVADAPAQFQAIAESVETALGEVDDRQTANAVKPVVRATLAQLAEADAVTGQTGYVTADTTATNNGAYVYNGTAWLPLFAPAKRYWKGSFRRSDNSLNINPGSITAMTVKKTAGSDDVTVSSVTNGSKIFLPAGRWLARCVIQFAGISDQTWMSIEIKPLDGATTLTPCNAERSTSGNGYDCIDVIGVVQTTERSQGVQINFTCNNAGKMRTDGQISLIEL